MGEGESGYTGDARARGERAAAVALEIHELCKAYVKGRQVNDHVSLVLHRGEVFGLLGPNGAGKTTLVSQIIGLARPDAGSITLEGVDIVAHPDHARRQCSYQAQTQVPISGLTARQAIELVGRVRGGRARLVRERAGSLLEHLEMEEWAGKRADTFSGGMRRLVAFCMAAVVPGRIVILDEPTNDIDPLRRRLLWQEVRELVDMGSTVLLVTHNVLEAERAVDRLAIMDRGRVVGAGTPASLKGEAGESMQMEVVVEPGAPPPVLPDFVGHGVITGRRIIGRVAGREVGSAIQWARGLKESTVVEEYSIGPITLEDVYLSAIGRGGTALEEEVEDEADPA